MRGILWILLGLQVAPAGFAQTTSHEPASDPVDCGSLFMAAYNGCLSEAEKFLQAGENPNLRYDYRNYGEATPFYVAAHRGHLELMQLLLRYHADPNIVGNFRCGGDAYQRVCYRPTEGSPLKAAVLADQLEVVKWYLQRGADANQVFCYEGGKTARVDMLSLAVSAGAKPSACLNHAVIEDGNVEALRYLLSIGSFQGTLEKAAIEVLEWINRIDTPARLAMLDEMLKAGLDPNGGIPHEQWPGGLQTYLGQAVDSRWEKGMRLLIDHGATPKHPNNRLILFAGGPLPIAKLLVSLGADPLTRDEQGKTALFGCQDAETTDWLISQGVDPNAEAEVNGHKITALTYKASTPRPCRLYRDELFTAYRTLAKKSNVNHASFPLGAAIANDRIDMADFLIGEGADIHHVDPERGSLFQFLDPQEFETPTLDYLLGLKFNINEQDPSGYTLLAKLMLRSPHWEHDPTRLIEDLLKRGADPNVLISPPAGSMLRPFGKVGLLHLYVAPPLEGEGYGGFTEPEARAARITLLRAYGAKTNIKSTIGNKTAKDLVEAFYPAGKNEDFDRWRTDLLEALK